MDISALARPGRPRRLVVVATVILLIGLLGAIAVARRDGLERGPLQPTSNVNSFGMYADDGSVLSLVVQLRGEQAFTATLRSVALVDPDPGLTFVDAGVLVEGYPGGYVERFFPVGELAPIEGATFTSAPGSSDADIFINLGIRVAFGEARLSAHGVWVEYEVESTSYRALLPWLLTVCQPPVTTPCEALPASQFSFPP